MKTTVQFVKEYFSTPERPVTMDEMKALEKEDRYELADAIAKEQGLTPAQTPDGRKYK